MEFKTFLFHEYKLLDLDHVINLGLSWNINFPYILLKCERRSYGIRDVGETGNTVQNNDLALSFPLSYVRDSD